MADRTFLPYSFLGGLYVAIDALPGSQLVVDGPYCVAEKAEMQYGHNLNSTLFAPHDFSRVMFTLQDKGVEEVTSLTVDRAEKVANLLAQVQGRPGCALVLTTAFDFVHLTGLPLEHLAEKRSQDAPAPVWLIPSQSLGGDWLDGYAAVLDTLAARVRLRQRRARPGACAVVGYLFDRAEPDHFGNLSELAKLCGAVGLDPCSIWLQGQHVDDLARVDEAEFIVSFPYARAAARRLGERLHIDVLEADLPIGLGATERLLRQLGERAGRSAAAEAYIATEAEAAVRATERAVLRFVAGKDAEIALDPHLARAVVAFCRECGVEPIAVTTPCHRSRQEDAPPVPATAARGADSGQAVFCVAPPVHQRRATAVVPVLFGYPNPAEHPLTDRPFMGFAGFRNLVEKFATAALRAEHDSMLAAQEEAP